MQSSKYSKLSIANKRYLSRYSDEILVKLGFTALQKNDIRIYHSSTSLHTIPKWYELGLDREKLKAAGINGSVVNMMPEKLFHPAGWVNPSSLGGFSPEWISMFNISPYSAAVANSPITNNTGNDEGVSITLSEPVSLDEEPFDDSDDHDDHEDHQEQHPVFISNKNGFVTEETAHDLNVKYQDCFGIKNGKVIRLSECGHNGNTIVAYWRDIVKGKMSQSLLEPYSEEFDFTLPKLGLVNVEDYMIYIERRHKKSSPARYRKGIRPDLLRFHSLCHSDLKEVSRSCISELISDDESNFTKLAESLFFPKTFTYEEALAEVRDCNRIAAAFSSNFGVRLDFHSDKIILNRYYFSIGTYNVSTDSWDMLTDIFNEELLKLGLKINE